MTALAAVACLVVVAAWAQPLPVARNTRPLAPVGRHRRRRQLPPTVDEWAALLDAMSAEVRTGSSLASAFDRAVNQCQPHGKVVNPTATLALVSGCGGATAEAGEAVVLQAVRAVHALRGPIAVTLDAAAALLRERSVIRGEALAYSAQARLSARVLTGVPVAFAGWNALSSTSFRTAVLSPFGLVSAVMGGVCNLLGWWWMRRIVEKALA